MGFINMFIKNLKGKSCKDDISFKPTAMSVDLLKDAESKGLSFGKEIEILKSNSRSEVSNSSNVSQSDLFIDN